MATQIKKTPEIKSAEFMLKEFDRVNQLWVDENRQAEQRIGFFLTIATAAIGALALILGLTGVSAAEILLSSKVILIILLLFGFVFLNRLNARSTQVYMFRKALAEIQDYFGNRDPEVAEYLARQRALYRGRKYRFGELFILSRLSGVLYDVMILANSLISGGIVFVSLIEQQYNIAYTILTVALASIVQHIYCAFIKRNLPPWVVY